MALTDKQKADVRRFAGYPQVGANHTLGASQDFAYGWVLPGVMETLESLLGNLRPENESILIETYLTNLSQLETDIIGVRENMDTKAAAVWIWNEKELADRKALFKDWRKRLCEFLGIPAGPALTQGTRIVRG